MQSLFVNSFDYAHPLEILFIRLVSKPSRIRPYFITHNAFSSYDRDLADRPARTGPTEPHS